MAATPQDPRKTVQEVRQLLDELFDTPGSMAITNQSMKVLLYGLWQRLDYGLTEHSANRAFKGARILVREVRGNMWQIAQTEVLVRNGQRLPLMSESKAIKVLNLCPEKPEWP
jgi:hypothetical protein